MQEEDPEEEVIQVLHLASLAEGMLGMTPARGACYAEAGSVCLQEQGHGVVVDLEVVGSYARKLSIIRGEVTDQMKASYNDNEKATEDGACGLSILIVTPVAQNEDLDLEQSRKGTSFDYWLKPRGEFLFREGIGLEVTGIRKGNDSKVVREVEKRRARFERYGDPRAKGLIIVAVEFSRPKAHILRIWSTKNV